MKANLLLMKNILLLSILVFFGMSNSFGQENVKRDQFFTATFCGKMGNGDKSEIVFTLDELKKCDWRILMVDENYLVTGFKLSIVPKNKSMDLIEQEISGNIIPEESQSQIMTFAKTVFLEYIKAKKSNGETVPVRPIQIVINLE